MHFIVLCRDKPDPSLRLKARAAHLRHASRQLDVIAFAGPLIEEGRVIGSLFVFDVEHRAALHAELDRDPYFQQDIFASVDIWETKQMIPESRPGSLAEAARQAAGA